MKVYQISCAKCSSTILTYEKHGAGKGILRLYLENITGPHALVKQLRGPFERIQDVPNLTCTDCGEVLGVPVISKGKRPAFRMRQGLFHRKLIK